MVALIDTNVILNYITDREDRFRDSLKVVMAQEPLLIFREFMGIPSAAWRK